MQTITLSAGEKAFQSTMIANGMRMDGRDLLATRPYKIEMNPLPLSPASCRIIWGHGYGDTTEIIASVSTEIATNDHARFDLSVKALPGSFGSNIDATEICQVIRSTLDHFLVNSEALEPEQFIIFNSPYSWKIFIDVLIVKAAGGVYEAAMKGIEKSLEYLTFPQLIITPGETATELHFDVDETKHPEKIIIPERIPEVKSFSASNDTLIADPTPTEVSSVQSLIIVGVSKDGSLLGMNHFGECGLRESLLKNITELVSPSQ